MKRIISALLALVLTMSALLHTSCESTDPQTIVNDAMTNVKNADAFEANLSVIVNMHYEGDEDDVFAEEIHVVAKDARTDTPEIIFQRTMYILGMPFTTYTYTDSEEWGYIITSLDTKYKSAYEDIAKSVDTAEVMRLIFKFTPTVFDRAARVKNSDGTTTVKFDVEKNLFHELYKKLLDTQNSRMEVESSNLIRISNARVEITVEDGYVRDYFIYFDMDSDGETYARSASVVVELNFLAFGDDVEITPPEGYLDYPIVEETAEDSTSDSENTNGSDE